MWFFDSKKNPTPPPPPHTHTHRRDWNFLGGGGSVRSKHLKKYDAQLEFPEGWRGGLRKIPFHGGGMDIFWNYTITFATNVSSITDLQF